MRHVTPLRALRSPGKPVNFSSAKHPRISAASNLFPRKNILLFALSEKSSDFFSRRKERKFLYFSFLFLFFFSRLPEKEIIFDLYKYNVRISWKLISEIIYCIEHVSWSRTYVLPSIEFTNLKPEAPVLYYPDESTSF